MYKLLVFDLDGTLLDTLDDITDSVNFALSQFSLPPRTREEVRSFVGNGVVNLIKCASNKEDVKDIVAVFKAHYAANCAVKTKPFEGMMEALRIFRSRGFKLAVLSNKPDKTTQVLVKELFPDVFDEAMGENEAIGIKRKPDPSALLALMQKFGVSGQETAYIGDSEVDIQTAKNAGTDCISMTWGFRDEADLRKAGATMLAHNATELTGFCLKE